MATKEVKKTVTNKHNKNTKEKPQDRKRIIIKGRTEYIVEAE